MQHHLAQLGLPETQAVTIKQEKMVEQAMTEKCKFRLLFIVIVMISKSTWVSSVNSQICLSLLEHCFHYIRKCFYNTEQQKLSFILFEYNKCSHLSFSLPLLQCSVLWIPRTAEQCHTNREHFSSSVMLCTMLEVWNLPFAKFPTHQPVRPQWFWRNFFGKLHLIL